MCLLFLSIYVSVCVISEVCAGEEDGKVLSILTHLILFTGSQETFHAPRPILTWM